MHASSPEAQFRKDALKLAYPTSRKEIQHFALIEIRECQLPCQTQRQSRMLQHVRKTQKIECITRGVYAIIRVFKVRLYHKGTRVSRLARTRMIGTCIPAFRLHVWNLAIRLNHFFDKIRQCRGHIIRDDAHGLGLACIQRFLYETCHILLKHSKYAASFFAVVREYRLAAQQTAFFSAIPMKFERIGHIAEAQDGRVVREQDAQRLQDRDGSTSVVIGARRRKNRRQKQVNAVLMRTNDNSLVGLARQCRDDTVLAPGMFEMFDECTIL